jgi:pilus assembly protein Flp/PilA
VHFLKSEDGPTAVEYAIMLSLIIVVAMSAIAAVGNTTSGIWSSDVQKLNGAMS